MRRIRRRQKTRYKGNGVPPGYTENWAYHGRWSEKKIKKGLWKFRFRATKRRRATTFGSFGVGTTGAWSIKGIQYIKKTNKGEYQTDFRGTKVPIRFNVKRPRRNRRKW